MSIMKKAGVGLAGVMISLTLLTATAYAAEYRVLQNDSLYKIGILFKTPVSTIMSDNNLNSSMIYPGQVLNIPAQVYTVKSGDTLFLIANRYGLSVTALRQANNKWDDLIMPGQQLTLPGIKPADSTAAKETVIPYTAEEVNLLARLITAETTGQPYDAMVGVGAVVVNRVQSPDWPNNISGVINQVINGYYQFTPVKNGQINNPPSDTAVKATWAALYGSDPSNQAMFYFDDSSTNQWMWSKPITARIGAMVFVK
jgi:N-acetylmuramoyl-L-alanine amidase